MDENDATGIADRYREARRAQLEEISGDSLRCRTLMHPWKPYNVKTDRKNKVLEQELWCPECDSHKILFISSITGEFVKDPVYKYSPGYLAHDIGRLDRRDRGILRIRYFTNG